MATKFQLSCSECRRKKVKCSRLLPCTNCVNFNSYCYYVQTRPKFINLLSDKNCSPTKPNVQSHMLKINAGDRNIGNNLSRYKFNLYLKFEKRLEGLGYMLTRLVDQSMIDPKIQSIMEGFDFKLYDNTFGSKISRKVVKSKPKLRLYHPEVSSEINDLLSDLVDMSFEYSIICPVSFTTIQECYTKSGINSYLVNCIASSMLPHYMMLRGRLERLELPENVFYLRALHLFNSTNTYQMEIVWGTPFMLSLEMQFGNIINGFLHLSKLKSISYELGLHCLDEQHFMSPRIDDDLRICEMRNAWWACLNIEHVSTFFFMTPINLVPNPMQTQIPHPDVNFNPSPFDQAKSISDHLSTISDSLHLKESHFNSLAKLTWITGCIGTWFNMYLKFCKDQDQYYNSYQTLLLESWKLYKKSEYHFNLDRYLENLQSDPVYYATTSQLTIHLAFHSHVIIHWFIQNKIDTYFNQHGHAMVNLGQAKTHAKLLLKFIRSTITLPDYPPPTLDLTDYYLSGPAIPFILMHAMKVFFPVQSQHDLESLKLIATVLRKYSIVSLAWERYFKWTQNIIHNNGRFNIKPSTEEDNLSLRLLEYW